MNVLEKLKQQGHLLLDGSMGACLIAKKIDTRRIAGLSLSDPQSIKEVHTGYLEAGCDVILTNTFSSNEMNLNYNGITAAQASKAGVDLARECVSAYKDRFVAYDVGPSGNVPMNLKDMRSWEYYTKFFTEQLESAFEAGVDLVLVETMFSAYEALGALKAAKQLDEKMPVFVSMTFTAKGRTNMGDKLENALKMMIDNGADAVGMNCSLTPKDMLPLIEQAKTIVGDFPLLAEPNRGEPKTAPDGTTSYEMSAEDFAKDTFALKEAGADIIGGCCGADKACMERIAALLGKR